MDIVVQKKFISEGAPPFMPTTAEVQVSAEEAMQIRDAAQSGDLYVRVENTEGERKKVVRIWVNPHNSSQMTFFLAD